MSSFPATIPAFSLAAFNAIDGDASGADVFVRHMSRGAAFDRGGMPDFAIIEFEFAAAQRRGDANAASACASVLLQLGRAQAAHERLQAHQAALQSTAEGACNLAVVAGHAGKRDEARRFYARALEIDANNRRALAGLSRLAADDRAWEEALLHASRCAALSAPQELDVHTYLIDILLLARRPADALKAATMAIDALGDKPPPPELRVRQGLAHACLGSWDAARQALASADPAVARPILAVLGLPTDPSPRESIDVPAIYVRYAVANIAEGTGLYDNALPKMLRALLASPQAASPRTWRAARAIAPSLGLAEKELAALHSHADESIAALAPSPPVPFGNRWLGDSRWRIGVLVPRLDAQGAAATLTRQFVAHDRSRFALHVYAQTPRADDSSSGPVRAAVDQFVEMAHMSDAEAVARIRLDDLHLMLDLTADTPDARPALISGRAARLLVRLGTDFPQQPPAPYDYAISDVHTHARMPPGTAGALVRLPYSPWLAGPPSAPAIAVVRTGGEAVRFGVEAPIASVDRETLATWLRVLEAAPMAELWFSHQPLHIQNRLRRRATDMQTNPVRIRFAEPGGSGWADVLLDPLRRNAPEAVAAALCRGMPVLACAGLQVSARSSAAILAAAGLQGAVAPDPSAYQRMAVDLATRHDALPAAVHAVQACRSDGPWWDVGARARELESAWLRMIDRQRQGSPPAAFDLAAGEVPAQPPDLVQPAS